MRALVTGSAGFIGSEIYRALAAAGWEVHGVDIAAGFDFDVRHWCPSGYGDDGRWDAVVHCAAAVVSPAAKAIGGTTLAANLGIDAALFEWAGRADVGRVVYVSSSCAYPAVLTMVRGRPLKETDIRWDSPRWPDGLYGWIKLTGELLATEARNAGVPVSVVRPFSVYGPGMQAGFAVRGFADQVRRRADPIVIWGNDTQTRDHIHVTDVAAAVVAMIRDGIDGPVNLGTGHATTLRDLALGLAAAAGYTPEIRVDASLPAGVPWLVADTARLREFYQPKISLESVLGSFVT